jgi:hypothetical protein
MMFQNRVLTQYTVSNGATLMPNTFMMQENIRTCFDQYIDDEEDGKDVETPFVYCVPKGARGRCLYQISSFMSIRRDSLSNLPILYQLKVCVFNQYMFSELTAHYDLQN